MFMVGGFLRIGSIAAWIIHYIAYMGGCLGCYKAKLISSSLRAPLDQNNQAQGISKATEFEGYWTTGGTCEMDNSAVQSHGSISSTSTLTQMHDSRGAASSIKPDEFVNHGLLLWNQSRQKWVRNKKPGSRSHQQLLEPTISWNSTYESLLSSNKPFRKPIPLGEMVNFLVDIWEQEGMYD